MYHKWRSYDVWFLRYRARQIQFVVILSYFLHSYSQTTQKDKILKKFKEKTPRDHYFTQVYHKWQSYKIWFLRYEVQQAESFCHFVPFFPFIPLTTQKIKILKMCKKTWRYHFTQVYQKSWSYAILFLKYCAWRTYGRTDGRTEVIYRGGCPT